MNNNETMKLALEALQFGLHVGFDESSERQIQKGGKAFDQHNQAITALRQAIEQAQQAEPVAVKQMMRWVDSLKRLSDNGQHMKISSGLSAGTCWELAVELEQFIKVSAPPRQWVGLTDDERQDIALEVPMDAVLITEAKLKEKNT